MLWVIIYSLFSEDVRILFFGTGSDETFMYLTIASLAAFTIEISLTSYGRPDYINSFFFWLDILSTLSILTDIEPVWEAMTGGGEQSGNDE